jgi:hypothetical protein
MYAGYQATHPRLYDTGTTHILVHSIVKQNFTFNIYDKLYTQVVNICVKGKIKSMYSFSLLNYNPKLHFWTVQHMHVMYYKISSFSALNMHGHS